MSKVHILPPELVSKIAAGEVIERPASVVKELMENALDAGATSIEVHLQNAGKTSILIKDNGSGIDRDDLEKIFFRHATSKINSLDDLFNIMSLGFRGEALYSIAAISDVTLKTKTTANDSGWEIHLRGGQKLTLKPASQPKGTEVHVQELFLNTPARKKFLKSNSTELHQILNTFLPYALIYPERRFVLTHDGKTLFDLSPCEKPTTRAALAFNLTEKHLIETKTSFQEAGLTIRMLLGDINIQRSRKDLQFIFVNNRPVQHRSISFHVNQKYQLIFPPDAHPFFAVFIDIPASQVDVNTHPTKREVKIKNEEILSSILRNTVERTLMSQGTPREGATIFTFDQKPNEPNAHFPKDTSAKAENAASGYRIPFEPENLQMSAHNTAPQGPFLVFDDVVIKNPAGLIHKLANAKFVGIAFKKYVLFETPSSLLWIDQHAAQERIVFEKLVKQMNKNQVEVQNLLSPIVIKLTVQEFLVWEMVQPKLDQIGFASTQFDKETIAVHSYPVLIKNPELSIRQLLSGDNITRCDNESVARRACRQSVMAGDSLSAQEAEYQRAELLKCADPFVCPHGRPTIIEIKEESLNKQFLRT